MIRVFTAALLVALPVSTATRHQTSVQQTPVLIDIRDLQPHELRSDAFQLESPQTLQIDAAGAGESRTGILAKIDDQNNYWRGNAWILNARTRDVVWELRRAETRSARRGVERYDGTLELPAGEYEVYYSSYSALSRTSVGGALSWLTGRGNRNSFDDDGLSENFRLTIRGKGRRVAPVDLQRMREGFRSNAILSLNAVSHEEPQTVGFQLSKQTAVDVYAIGEAYDRDQLFDFGYIINADTHQKVWTFNYDRSKAAGGSPKNRLLRETITLPAGRYAAIYAQDDSHDPSEWNAAPPFDPAGWGLTLRVRPEDRASVTAFEYDPTPAENAIVTLTRMRNSDTRSMGFTLTRPMDVRVYALGEGSNGEMHDYGWIVDAVSRKRVWVMDYDRTEHAGGAQKNRLANQVVRLEKGSYMVYFQTDDSHAFRSFNSSAPIGPEDWGISLFSAQGPLDKSAIAPFDERAVEASAGVIARILNVGDDESRSRTFSLDRDSEIRVYALGEGSDDQMFDYAWIENPRTGRTVWEMTYGTTQHAGGARKNRVFDDVIRLPAGEYILRYKSDDSHSMDSWNSEPPTDPSRWGVTIFRAR